jgi:hypothetical protein
VRRRCASRIEGRSKRRLIRPSGIFILKIVILLQTRMRPGVIRASPLCANTAAYWPCRAGGISFFRCQFLSLCVVNLQPLEEPFGVCSSCSLTEVSSLDFGPAPRGAFFAVSIEQLFSLPQARDARFRRAPSPPRREMRHRQIEAEALPKKVTIPSNNAQRVLRCCKQGGANQPRLRSWLSSQELGMVLGQEAARRGSRRVAHHWALFGCDPVQGVSTAGSVQCSVPFGSRQHVIDPQNFRPRYAHPMPSRAD